MHSVSPHHLSINVEAGLSLRKKSVINPTDKALDLVWSARRINDAELELECLVDTKLDVKFNDQGVPFVELMLHLEVSGTCNALGNYLELI